MIIASKKKHNIGDIIKATFKHYNGVYKGPVLIMKEVSFDDYKKWVIEDIGCWDDSWNEVSNRNSYYYNIHID